MDLERAHSFTIQLDFEDVPELAFGPDGQLVAVSDGEVVIIDGQDSVSFPLPDDIQRVTDIDVLRSDLAVQFAGA